MQHCIAKLCAMLGSTETSHAPDKFACLWELIEKLWNGVQLSACQQCQYISSEFSDWDTARLRAEHP